ncbi:RidA family protein [bacterium]|jgi:2-iminobutanoate/2-iminopropanoate deaminase|nr:RidA family protein [bacterium]
MKKEVLTPHAPAPIGPYSQAIETASLVFCSGQIPLDPSTGQIVGEGNVEAQTAQVMKNISAVLKQADLGFQNVVKTTIFLKNMGDFPKVNALYAESFTAPFPARSTVEVARLPKDVLVEIEVIASR